MQTLAVPLSVLPSPPAKHSHQPQQLLLLPFSLPVLLKRFLVTQSGVLTECQKTIVFSFSSCDPSMINFYVLSDMLLRMSGHVKK